MTTVETGWAQRYRPKGMIGMASFGRKMKHALKKPYLIKKFHQSN
jgi:hypothetical protein